MLAGRMRLKMLLGLIVGLVTMITLGYGLATLLRLGGGPFDGSSSSSGDGLTIAADSWHRQAINIEMDALPPSMGTLSGQVLTFEAQDGVHTYFGVDGGYADQIEVDLDDDRQLEEVWMLEEGGLFSGGTVTRYVWLDDDGSLSAIQDADVTLLWTGNDWEIVRTRPSVAASAVLQELSGDLSQAARAQARDSRFQRLAAEARSAKMIARSAELRAQSEVSANPVVTSVAGEGATGIAEAGQENPDLSALVAPRAWDDIVISMVGDDLGTDTRKDVTEVSSFKVDLYQDAGFSTMNRASVDLDRDDLWDEEYTIDGSEITLRVAPADDEDYTVTWTWAGAGWVVGE